MNCSQCRRTLAGASRMCAACRALVRILRAVSRVGGVVGVTVLALDGDELSRVAELGRRGTRRARSTVDRENLVRRVIRRRRASVDGASLALPLVRHGTLVGALLLERATTRPFSRTQIGRLEPLALAVAVEVDAARLTAALARRDVQLADARERQAATAEILGVISRSETDAQPVFDAIIRNAVRPIGGIFGTIHVLHGDLIHFVAQHGYAAEPVALAEYQARFPRRLRRTDPQEVFRPLLVDGDVVVIADTENHPIVNEEIRASYRNRHVRSTIAVPMRREGRPIGSIGVNRREPGEFTPSEVELLQSFADQAVIAIENARLLGELRARTAELTRSVGELSALGEVSRAVSSTLDLETVLGTIASRANQLTGLDGCSVFEYDEETETFRMRVAENYDVEVADVGRATPIRRGEGVVGRVADTRAPVQVADIRAGVTYPSRMRDAIARAGYRAVLAVPLLQEGRLLGAIVVTSKTPGEFPPETIHLLQTFGTQSAVAIQNARLYRQLEEKSRELEVASRHKSEFLASMSHELRTPLNAIIGYSEMLQEDAGDLGQPHFVDDLGKITSAGKHLLELINAVLDLTKIEAGKMDLVLEDFEVPGLVQDLAAVIRPLAEKNRNRLEVFCAPTDGTMHADLPKVRQSLLNLLSNACKFTQGGAVSLTVARGVEGDCDWLRFTVRDTGIGMTPEQVGRLFQEFTQVDAATSRRYGGTGLGLALSRRLCRMMGGDITVESELGLGSTFTIGLPAVVLAPTHPGTSAPADSAAATPLAAEDGGLVLVVDDDPSMRLLMQRFLTKDGYRVALAGDGEGALRMARALSPDAITLDVMMPGLDGWAVLERLRYGPETSNIPIVVVTVTDVTGEERERLNRYAARVVQKGARTRDDLLRAMRDLIPAAPGGRRASS